VAEHWQSRNTTAPNAPGIAPRRRADIGQIRFRWHFPATTLYDDGSPGRPRGSGLMHFPDHPLVFIGLLFLLLLYIAVAVGIGWLFTKFNRRK
jgi:hypothetical protein